MKYLGLSVGASFKVKSIWDNVIEKIKCLVYVGYAYFNMNKISSYQKKEKEKKRYSVD